VTADTLTEAAEKVVAVLKASAGSAGNRAPGATGGEQATGEVVGGNGKP